MKDMVNDQKVVKDDINFLEYPNWVLAERSDVTMWTIKKPHGTYKVTSPYGLPSHFDKVVFYGILYQLYKKNKFKSRVLETSRYAIAKDVFSISKNFGKHKYDRIMKSLNKWQALSMRFEGIFYEGDGYTIRGFSMVDDYVLRKETGALTIRFNEEYIKHLKETKFYKLIDFEKYKKLHRASSARLYEILTKTFKARDLWAIHIQQLAEKMTFEKRKGVAKYYPSDVLRHLKPAVNEINKKTDMHFDFTYNKQTKACVFTKLKKRKTFTPATRVQKKTKPPSSHVLGRTSKSVVSDIDACMKYFTSLDGDRQKDILAAIKKQPGLSFIADKKLRIFTYLVTSKQWQAQ